MDVSADARDALDVSTMALDMSMDTVDVLDMSVALDASADDVNGVDASHMWAWQHSLGCECTRVQEP